MKKFQLYREMQTQKENNKNQSKKLNEEKTNKSRVDNLPTECLWNAVHSTQMREH